MITTPPCDIPDLQLKAIGRIAANWSLLEFMIGYVIADLLGIKRNVGRIVTSELNIKAQLDILKFLAKAQNWLAPERKALKKIINTILRARDKRNLVIHGLWAENNEGVLHLVKFRGGARISGKYVPMTRKDIDAIAQEVESAVSDFDAWSVNYDRRTASMAR